ncbi:hypothetical protein [Pseudoalteromonas sp. Of7M-16]|nr:hypothetical protein [Pseudoalteromonas sp. Of7M-16]MCG7546486.1 hypothetical protein [Pseudoalteromonas sp. Of7M-16]
MKILNKQMTKIIVGGDARAPDLPHRAQSVKQPRNTLTPTSKRNEERG